MATRKLSLALITVPAEHSETVAERLVQERLAACVQVSSPVTSFFWWEDAVQQEEERLLFIKTDSNLKTEIEAVLKEVHPYDVPELIFFRIQDGLDTYLSWMDKELD